MFTTILCKKITATKLTKSLIWNIFWLICQSIKVTLLKYSNNVKPKAKFNLTFVLGRLKAKSTVLLNFVKQSYSIHVKVC